MSIWQHEKVFSIKVDKAFQISLKEGNTPLERYDFSKLGFKEVYVKREDLNPTGSFKDRYIAYLLSYLHKEGRKNFVISSSGNAAISAIAYCRSIKAKLDCFVSPRIEGKKLRRLLKLADIPKSLFYGRKVTTTEFELRNGTTTIHFSCRPRSLSLKFLKETSATDLRGSVNSLAVEGYKTIPLELARQAKFFDALFLATSSGVSAIGTYQGFLQINYPMPQIHIVQTAFVNPVAKHFDKKFNKSETSLATAISDRVASLKEKVVNIVNETRGFGWVISDEELINAEKVFRNINSKFLPSYDSLLTVAALSKAKASNFNFKSPVLIFGG